MNEQEEQPTVVITSEPPTFTCRWRTLNGTDREYSTKDEEEFKQRSYALYLKYVNSQIRDFEIRVEV